MLLRDRKQRCQPVLSKMDEHCQVCVCGKNKTTGNAPLRRQNTFFTLFVYWKGLYCYNVHILTSLYIYLSHNQKDEFVDVHIIL